MLMYYSLPGFLAPSPVSPHWVSLMLLFPIHNSVLFLEGPRVLLCIPHIHATRSQALTFGQHLSPLCAVWNSSSLSAPPPPNTWALHWQHWWLLAHPSSCKSECHPGLLPPFTHSFDGQVFLSLLLISLAVTRLHLTCLMQAFGSSLLGFFICHQLVFLFSFSLSSQPPSHFLTALRGIIIKCNSDCVNPLRKILPPP